MEKQGKQQVVPYVRPSPPALASVTPLRVVAGKNPEALNLKDHPYLSGKVAIIVEARFKESEAFGPYVLFGAYVVDGPDVEPKESDFRVLMTGAENVYDRIAIADHEHAFPVSGTLRQSGRAWFLD